MKKEEEEVYKDTAPIKIIPNEVFKDLTENSKFFTENLEKLKGEDLKRLIKTYYSP